jgi:hypothetical protein
VKAASYMEIKSVRGPDGGLMFEVTVHLDTLTKVVSFASDMAAGVAWWHRPFVFGAVLIGGAMQLVRTRLGVA